jgi:hypothetical protein
VQQFHVEKNNIHNNVQTSNDRLNTEPKENKKTPFLSNKKLDDTGTHLAASPTKKLSTCCFFKAVKTLSSHGSKTFKSSHIKLELQKNCFLQTGE